MALLLLQFPCSETKLQNVWKGSWAISKALRKQNSQDTHDLGTVEVLQKGFIWRRTTCLLKSYDVECSHSSEFSCTFLDIITIRYFEFYCPLHNSLMVLFSVSQIFPFKFPFSLISLFCETYLLITHMCTSASPWQVHSAYSWHCQLQSTAGTIDFILPSR